MKTTPEREPGRLLTAAALADRLGVKPDTVRQWARRGQIPTYRAGIKTLRFDLSAVLEALRQRGGATHAK